MIILKRTDSGDKDFKGLVEQLNQYLQVKYGVLQDFYSQYNKIDSIPNVVVAYIDDEPAGCGCFKPFDDDSAEVKRMYAADQHRGKGVGHAVLQELEKWAAELGHQRMVLETGYQQPEAALLYKRAGYNVIPNYGQYIGMEETSICMQKTLFS